MKCILALLALVGVACAAPLEKGLAKELVELMRESKNIYTIQQDDDNVYVQLQRQLDWPNDFKVKVFYYLKGEESKSTTAMDSTLWDSTPSCTLRDYRGKPYQQPNCVTVEKSGLESGDNNYVFKTEVTSTSDSNFMAGNYLTRKITNDAGPNSIGKKNKLIDLLELLLKEDEL